MAAASKLHSLYRKSIEKTVRATTALYLRVVMVVCAAFCNGLGEELTRSSIAAATYRINFFFCQLPSQSFMKKKAVNHCAVTYFL